MKSDSGCVLINVYRARSFCETRFTHDVSVYNWIKESYEATYGMRVKCSRKSVSAFYMLLRDLTKLNFLCRGRTRAHRGGLLEFFGASYFYN